MSGSSKISKRDWFQWNLDGWKVKRQPELIVKQIMVIRAFLVEIVKYFIITYKKPKQRA